jgi:hypothetical protein
MDIETLLGIFGDDMALSDGLRQSTGDVSDLGEVLQGPGGPYDDSCKTFSRRVCY